MLGKCLVASSLPIPPSSGDYFLRRGVDMTHNEFAARLKKLSPEQMRFFLATLDQRGLLQEIRHPPSPSADLAVERESHG